MALRRRQPVERSGRSVTAAGRKVDFTSTAEIKGLETRPLRWQTRSYNFYDPSSDSAIGEVWFSGRYVSESMARIRLVPAIQLSADADPVPLTDAGLDGMAADDRPDDSTIELLQAAVARLTNSHGGQADIMRGASLNNFLAGESFVIGRTLDGQEEWEAHSIDALEVIEAATDSRAAVMGLKALPTDTREQMARLDQATIIRIWRRHPRFPELPDAAMGAALTYCEDLYALTQMIRAAARSRMPSGILKYPSTIAPVNTDDDDPDADKPDPFMESLIRHFSEPIKNPNDAAALVPFLLRMDPEDLQHVEMLDFSREIDRLAVDLRRESREAFAATIDLPADVLTGKQGLNDWSAWNVDEETFRVHLAPHAELIVDALTAGYLWPTLTGIEGHWAFRIWYDASNLVTHPNQAENAKAVHAAYGISDATLRRSTGFSETDAPDDAEIQKRLEIERARVTPGPGQPAGGAENGAPTPEPTEVAASSGPAGIELDALLVGDLLVERDPRDSLGYRLAAIERSLIERLLTAADSELRRALQRAGNVVATASRRRGVGESVRQIVAAYPTEELPRRLGETLLASISLTGDDLLDGAFASLADRWDTWVERAQLEALTLIAERGGSDPAEVIDRHRDRLAADREAGWQVLQAALVTSATRRLFSTEQPRALGESDPSRLVDPHSLRAALSMAGGWPVMAAGEILQALLEAERTGQTVQVETAATEPPIRGLMSGDSVREALAEQGIATVGYVWIYGDPSSRQSSFDPHLNLDGVEFSSFDDAVLVNDGGYPDTDFYYPDDHFGCQCTYAVLDAPETQSEADLEVELAADERAAAGAAESVDAMFSARFPDVTTAVSENDTRIVLSRIEVLAEARGTGIGSRVMSALTEYADQRGLRVDLSPSTDFGASSKARLVEFYKRFGFVENKGRNIDHAISETMYREPVK